MSFSPYQIMFTISHEQNIHLKLDKLKLILNYKLQRQHLFFPQRLPNSILSFQQHDARLLCPNSVPLSGRDIDGIIWSIGGQFNSFSANVFQFVIELLNQTATQANHCLRGIFVLMY